MWGLNSFNSLLNQSVFYCQYCDRDVVISFSSFIFVNLECIQNLVFILNEICILMKKCIYILFIWSCFSIFIWKVFKLIRYTFLPNYIRVKTCMIHILTGMVVVNGESCNLLFNIIKILSDNHGYCIMVLTFCSYLFQVTLAWAPCSGWAIRAECPDLWIRWVSLFYYYIKKLKTYKSNLEYTVSIKRS